MEQRLVERQHLVQILYLVHLHLSVVAEPETSLVQGYQVAQAVAAAEMAQRLELVVRALLDKEIRVAQILLPVRFLLAAVVAHLWLAQQVRDLHQVLVAQERHPASRVRPLHTLVAGAAAAMVAVSGLALVDLVAAAQAHLQAQEMPEQQTLAAAAAVHQMLLLMRVVLAAQEL